MDDVMAKKLYEKDVEIRNLQARLGEQQKADANRRLAAQIATDMLRLAQSPTPEQWSHLFDQILAKLEGEG